MSARPRVAVVGVGAVGSAIAAAVEQAGRAELILCGRAPRDHLVVENQDGEVLVIPKPVLSSPASTCVVDWVVLAVKAHQTHGAVAWLQELVGDMTTVVVAQNGVEHRERLASVVDPRSVVPAVVRLSAERAASGHVKVTSRQRISVADSDDGRRFRNLLAGSALSVELLDDFCTCSWQKLCWNAVAALMALSGQTTGMFRQPEARDLAMALVRECIEVGRAEGALLTDDMAASIADDLADLPAASSSSIVADMRAGRALEWDARNGVIRRLGVRHGIPTPISDVLVPLLAARDDHRSGPA